MAGRGMSMTERAEEVANNVWLKLVGRFAMAIVGALLVPVLIGIWTWAAATSKDLDMLRSRVIVLETNDVRNQADRELFQEEAKKSLTEILRLVSAGSERQARVETKVEGIQRQLDAQTP